MPSNAPATGPPATRTHTWPSGGMADALDLKSSGGQPPCGFDSRLGYLISRLFWPIHELGRHTRRGHLRLVLRPQRAEVPIMPEKPAKPYAEFPLYAHSAGVWAKKIRGKVHYFGRWGDPNGALEKYLAQRDFLHAGRQPPAPKDTVQNLLDQFMSEKLLHLEAGEINNTTFKEYETTCEVIHVHFGKHRPLEGLTVEHFQTLRSALTKGKRKGVKVLSAVTQKRRLTIARMIFAEESVTKRKALKSPSQRLLRAARKHIGVRLYEPDELRRLVKYSAPPFRAMVLLGINCGFGPQDCFTLPTHTVDLKHGWHTYARPKTEVERRCALWPETVKAIKAIKAGSRIFEGEWDRWLVGREFGRSCDRANVTNKGFYTLRRTFETIAAACEVSQPVIDTIMGHARQDMASVYRQKVFDDLLRKCSSQLREWYRGTLILR